MNKIIQKVIDGLKRYFLGLLYGIWDWEWDESIKFWTPKPHGWFTFTHIHLYHLKYRATKFGMITRHPHAWLLCHHIFCVMCNCVTLPDFDNFLPRDAMRKCSLCNHPVSVCLSVCRCTLLYCIHVTEDIVNILSRPGSPIILVFLTPSSDTQFQGEPLQRAQNTWGWEKFAIFDRNRYWSRKR